MSSQSHHITPLLFSKLITCNYYRTISNIPKFYYMQLEIDRCRIDRNIQQNRRNVFRFQSSFSISETSLRVRFGVWIPDLLSGGKNERVEVYKAPELVERETSIRIDDLADHQVRHQQAAKFKPKSQLQYSYVP